MAPPASGVERKNRRVAALSPTSVAFVSGGVENYTPLSCQLQNLPWNQSSRGVAHNDLPARMTPPLS